MLWVLVRTASVSNITKTFLCNTDPIKPHFYIVKLGFTGVYIFFSYFCSKTRRFKRAPTIYVLSRNVKNIRGFYLKICSFWKLIFSIYLNRHVFVHLYRKHIVLRRNKTHTDLDILNMKKKVHVCKSWHFHHIIWGMM